MSPYDGKPRYPVRTREPVLRGGGLSVSPMAVGTLDLSVPFAPDLTPVVDLGTAIMTRIWLEFMRRLVGSVQNIAVTVGQFPGALSGTIAGQPTGLGPSNAGLIYSVLPPYAHMLRWNGSVWEFAPGDPGSGFLQPYVVVPGNASCWQECDGTATDYLVAGATTITTAPFTTPNLKTVSRYLKSGATAGIVAAATATGPGGTHAHTGTTDNPGNHTHDGGLYNLPAAGAGGSSINVQAGTGQTTYSNAFANGIAGSSGAAGGHAHSVSTNTVADHAHTSGEPASYTVRFYFRR